MKIIQVTANYLPTLGGVQKVVAELSSELSKRGHDVKVYTGFDGKKKVSGIKNNFEVFYLKSYEIAHTFVIPALFFKLLTLPKDSLIHVHVARAFVPEIVYLISVIKKIPFVAHFHLDVSPSGPAGFLLPIYKRLFLKIVLKKASKIIVFSQYYKRLLSKQYSINKNVVIIPNGVSTKFFVKRKTHSRKITQLLYVGRISHQKQVHILIDSLKYVKNKVVLNIVGNGELMSEIKKQAVKNKLKNVKFYGAKSESEVIKFYKSSDIFLLSSSKEGMPLVLLEAMASGMPVIASDVVGTHEFVGKTGILVKPVTPKKFAQKIDLLISNKKLQKKLSAASIGKSRNYSWDIICDKIERVYKNEIY